jgi:uncharacterized coiled-coil protein SlyX
MYLKNKQVDVDFLMRQIELLEGENAKLRRDNGVLLQSLESKTKQDSKKTVIDSDIDNLKKIISFQEQQIKNLEETIKNQSLTIKSLQENMVESQIHKIPQYQKTIMFLHESMSKLQEENEDLKRKIKA